jgi:hypothetical protein
VPLALEEEEEEGERLFKAEEKEEEEEEEGLFKANTVSEEDPERDRATPA